MEPFPFDDLVDYWQADAGDIEISTADDLYCNPNDALPNVNDVALPPSMAATTRTSYEKIPTRDSRSYVNAIGWQHPFQGIQNHSVPEGYAPGQGQLSQDSNSDECSEGSSWDIEWPWLTHDTRTDSFDSLCETGSTFPQPACEATNMEDESMQLEPANTVSVGQGALEMQTTQSFERNVICGTREQ
ncbi:hypothetical protein KC319_g682 [Hortaea werneckii]|nr:hypothetical protein KC317_g836 [Hortaea werneckii]KAI7683036.1 hypothetical protein KC319_g682 [Hortaea werneckii]